MFFLVGVFIALFLVLLLLVKKNKSRADKILMVWLFIMSIHQLYNYYYLSGYFFEHPNWLGVEMPLPIIHGVFLYLYVMEMTGSKFKKKWYAFAHFIPMLILIILTIPFLILSGEEKLYVFKNQGEGFVWYMIINSLFITVSGLVYSSLSLRLIKKYRISIQDSFSNTDKKDLQWLRLISIGFGILWILAILFESDIIFGAVVILVLTMAVFGINQLNIFNSNVVLTTNAEIEKPSNSINRDTTETNTKLKKYQKSGLNEEMASKIYTNLNDLVTTNEVYRNENLTLVELAKQLQIHPNHLSQVINEMEGKNFYNYINSLRIKEFIKLALLPESKKYTMISLAYDCGFSSKSTFNKHFKLNTGKTPTEFFKKEQI